MRLSLNPPIELDGSQSDPAPSIEQDITNDIPAESPAHRRNMPLRILVCVFAVAGFLLGSVILLGSTLGCG
jgi:hypothetical protein